MVTANQGFAKENLAVASNRLVAVEKPVLGFDPDADFTNSAKFVNDVLDDHDGPGSISDNLGAFVSNDELEEFLRNFSEGTDEEAELQTQGEADVGGEPTSTVH